jgi:hypothetical protein
MPLGFITDIRASFQEAAKLAGFTSHSGRGPKAGHALTSNPDHSTGAGQLPCSVRRRSMHIDALVNNPGHLVGPPAARADAAAAEDVKKGRDYLRLASR